MWLKQMFHVKQLFALGRLLLGACVSPRPRESAVLVRGVALARDVVLSRIAVAARDGMLACGVALVCIAAPARGVGCGAGVRRGLWCSRVAWVQCGLRHRCVAWRLRGLRCWRVA